MKKIVWITFFSALVIVNALAWLANYAGGVYIAIPYRLVLVMAITMITTVFAGAWVLMTQAEEEVPNTRPASATSTEINTDPDSGSGPNPGTHTPGENQP
jgi:fatty acid desaturase